MDDFSGNWASSGSQQQISNTNLQLAKDTAKAESDVLNGAVMGGAPIVLDKGVRTFDRKTEHGGIYDVSSHQYPEDLFGADNTYGSNCIVFYINVQKDSQINVNGEANKDSDTVGDDISSKSAGKQPGFKSEKTEIKGQTAQGVTLGLQTGASIVTGGATFDVAKVVTGGASIWDGGTVISQAGEATRATKRLTSVIALHTPNAISASYSTDWDAEDTAKAQISALRWGGADTDPVKTAAMIGVLGTASIGAFIGGQLGQAANAKKEMMFKGVHFRSFTFDYKFAPRSKQELILVENIIKMFKFHMHPEYVKGSGNYLFLYPSEFDILHYNNGNENKHLPRYTSCALTNVNVQYTPNAYFTAFGDGDARGAPTEINMTLQFKELALLTKEDISNGY